VSAPVRSGLHIRKPRRPGRGKRLALLLALLFAALLYWVGLYLHGLGRGTVLSDARDMVTLAMGAAVERVLREEDWAYEDFVTLHTDESGSITAVTTRASQVNRFTARVLREITEAAERGDLDLHVNLGDFLGANLLLGRGPELRFRVGLMTSPDVKLLTQLSSTGINQTRHALVVKAAVDIDLFIPWGSVSSRVETDILVAETLIVGRVPDTYMNWEGAHGTSGSEREDGSAAHSGGGTRPALL